MVASKGRDQLPAIRAFTSRRRSSEKRIDSLIKRQGQPKSYLLVTTTYYQFVGIDRDVTHRLSGQPATLKICLGYICHSFWN